MPRWKKPTKDQTRELRRNLAARAATGDLRFPSAVIEIRQSIGLTQEQFAQMTGLTKRQVAEMEMGKANPTLETLEKIGHLFGFTIGFVPKSDEDIAPVRSQ
jgi:putative transcriptional regulator